MTLLREYAESDKWKDILPIPEPECSNRLLKNSLH